ncbi:hypothetical protein [Streptomyces sp. NPDC020141]|uniref:hypothetical protein n=1 Tax=Streptomyces sp. NPDC020141 TaxID=3365065 RepID=UPI00379122CE
MDVQLARQFAERIWESGLLQHLNRDDASVQRLVEALVGDAHAASQRDGTLTLHQHAARIEASIKAAYDDAYQLDDGDGWAVRGLDLNVMGPDGEPTGTYVSIDLPTTYWDD